MRSIIVGLLATAAIAIANPASAQVTVDTPAGGVSVGPRAHHYRDYDSPRYRPYAREGRGCRTITIHRDDGSMNRIQRCD